MNSGPVRRGKEFLPAGDDEFADRVEPVYNVARHSVTVAIISRAIGTESVAKRARHAPTHFLRLRSSGSRWPAHRHGVAWVVRPRASTAPNGSPELDRRCAQRCRPRDVI